MLLKLSKIYIIAINSFAVKSIKFCFKYTTVTVKNISKKYWKYFLIILIKTFKRYVNPQNTLNYCS